MFQFENRVPTLSQAFISWLHKLVEPKQHNRFQDAKTALRELQVLEGLTRLPEIVLRTTQLEFRSNRYGEKLAQTLAVSNPVPDTLLDCKCEVAPHPHDPPHMPDGHSWISIHPAEFSQNDMKCRVQVDTSKLSQGAFYERQLLLHTNASPKPRRLTLTVSTGSLNIKQLPYVALTLLLLIIGGLTWATMSGPIRWLIAAKIPFITGLVAAAVASLTIVIVVIAVWALLRLILTIVIRELRGGPGDWSYSSHEWGVGIIGWSVVGPIALIAVMIIGMDVYYKSSLSGNFYAVLGSVGDYLLLLPVMYFLELVYENLTKRGFKNSLVYTLLIFTTSFGITLGISFKIGSFSPALLLALTGTGLPLAFLSLYPPIQQNRLMARYRKSEERLIKP